MAKKFLSLLGSFIVLIAYVSLSYGDHCPNIKDIVKNGEWHCPAGWYIVEKQGKPSMVIMVN